MITKISKRRLIGFSFIICQLSFSAALFTSCDDFFNQESDDVLYAESEHLNNAVDTLYSVVGILGKMQALADRTILLGEVRGDLVDLTNIASNDLRELATFSVSDDNIFNRPADYYAVINNCNYFIAHADTTLRSNRDVEAIFMKEYAVVKAIRAWTYLQLVLNYGQVPFVTEPLLSKEEAEAAETGPKADLQTVCSYFIKDLSTIPEQYNTEYPTYTNQQAFRGVRSELLFFPLSIIRGELYLWLASVTGNKEDYKQAALHYYKYISERNGRNSAYPITMTYSMWEPGTSDYQRPTGRLQMNFPETTGRDDELITMIAGDSIRAEGNYSELRNYFTSREENDEKVSITPSQRMFDISAAQANCQVSPDGNSVVYAPAGLPDYQSGDLRLSIVYSEDFSTARYTGERIETQRITKYNSSRNVHLYRRVMVYIRMAEALNMAGYPRMAFQILSEGLSNRAIQANVMPYYDTEDKADSIFLANFDFNDTRYAVADVYDFINNPDPDHNQMGIHTRGSGFTPMNEYYVLPNDTIEPDLNKRAQLIKEQQVVVDSLLLNENALEFAFEGTRYYDLMRFAMRQSNPGAFLAKHIYARRGVARSAEVQSEIKVNLADQRNWYLNWKGKMGF